MRQDRRRDPRLAAEPDCNELIEVTFTPAEPQLSPGAARAVLAMLLSARRTAMTSQDGERGRT